MPPFIFSQIQKDALSDVERVSAFLVEVENKITLIWPVPTYGDLIFEV